MMKFDLSPAFKIWEQDIEIQIIESRKDSETSEYKPTIVKIKKIRGAITGADIVKLDLNNSGSRDYESLSLHTNTEVTELQNYDKNLNRIIYKDKSYKVVGFKNTFHIYGYVKYILIEDNVNINIAEDVI